MDRCGYCGDILPEPPALHVCWLAAQYGRQECLEPVPTEPILTLGQADEEVPLRVKSVDLSNY